MISKQIYHSTRNCLLLVAVVVGLSQPVYGDVVKPALTEITANTSGVITVEIRASIEALLTGINGQYKNTNNAPNADEYDQLRKLDATALRNKFEQFERTLLKKISLTADGVAVPLSIASVSIPEPGYTKVPRISIITLQASLDRSTESLVWYYPSTLGNTAVRVRQVDDANDTWYWSEWQWLKDGQPSKPFSLKELFLKTPVIEVIGSYIVLGYKHILPRGLDHILFILGLLLLARKLRPLLLQVTMFTIAHTITLGLAMNGIIELPARLVEPLIALSIAYIGLENIFSNRLRRSRLLLVFMFGLLHGLGFASVLSDFGMPTDAFVTALISFNVGVELGQISILLAVWLALSLLIQSTVNYRRFISMPLSVLIFLVGIYWTIDRLELF